MRIQKAFQNAPMSDFHDEKLKFELKYDLNGYTWTRVFAGCLVYEDTIAVPLNMPPAMVSSSARTSFETSASIIITNALSLS